MSNMLTFQNIIEATDRLIKGFTPEKMESAINAAQDQFTSEFQLPFLKREYHVITTDVGGDGPYFVYTASDGLTRANWLEPCSHPSRSHASGLIDSNYCRVRFRVEGESIYILDEGWAAGDYSFWCLKRPVQFVWKSVGTNYQIMETDFPSYCLEALSHLVASKLANFKKDRDTAKYYESLYRGLHAPLAKAKAGGDWGTNNSGGAQPTDAGVEQDWA